MKKWTAKELFESLTRETNKEEYKELVKAIIAYEANLFEYTDEIDKYLEDMFTNPDNWNLDYLANELNCEFPQYR